MSFDWIKTTWGEIASLEYGKALKDYKSTTEGYPVYGTNGPIGFTDKYLTNGPGVIVGRKGAYRGVHYSEGPFFVIDTAYYLMPFSREQVDIKWAYYNLKNIDINNLDSGSAIPSTSRADFYSLNVLLPSIVEQISIRNILDSLDKKIELNNAINKNLEEMAQALFKRWFIDFEFPNENGEPYKSSRGEFEESELGLIPRGWRVLELGEIIASISETYKTDKEKLIFLNTSDISEGKVLNKVYSDVSSLPGQAKKKIRRDDILYSEIRPQNKRYAYINFDAEDYIVSTKLMVLRSQKKSQSIFVYFYLTNSIVIDYLQMLAEARSGTFPQITYQQIKTLKICLPEDVELKRYSNIIESILKKIQHNNQEINNLNNIRDSLLPKLMSGEIRVPLDEQELVISE
ncbi:restriction endonuclease subunit S [Paenibacillus sanfengchensis]|uniref:restriction endonuclease subunit S n=1 Tax=Paenibacillus sanfengchensis TaxID=3119819 RepID=UPI002FDFBF00